jgi:hypothetical protein
VVNVDVIVVVVIVAVVVVVTVTVTLVVIVDVVGFAVVAVVIIVIDIVVIIMVVVFVVAIIVVVLLLVGLGRGAAAQLDVPPLNEQLPVAVAPFHTITPVPMHMQFKPSSQFELGTSQTAGLHSPLATMPLQVIWPEKPSTQRHLSPASLFEYETLQGKGSQLPTRAPELSQTIVPVYPGLHAQPLPSTPLAFST